MATENPTPEKDRELDDEVAELVEGGPSFSAAMDADNTDGVVKAVIDAIEAIGIDVRAQFSEMAWDELDDDDDDDCDDSFDDKELDDRWPGDDDEDDDDDDSLT